MQRLMHTGKCCLYHAVRLQHIIKHGFACVQAWTHDLQGAHAGAA